MAPDALDGAPARRARDDAAWREGLFAITDAGAQIVAELCGAAAGERILDACAGNGGKTAHLLALAGDRARVDAVDIDAPKLAGARATLQRLGLTGAMFGRADLTSRSPIRRRAITASCSTPRAAASACCAAIRRRWPGARRPISTALAAQQLRMLTVVAPALLPGGVLGLRGLHLRPPRMRRRRRGVSAGPPALLIETRRPRAAVSPGRA